MLFKLPGCLRRLLTSSKAKNSYLLACIPAVWETNPINMKTNRRELIAIEETWLYILKLLFTVGTGPSPQKLKILKVPFV
jgi:hypothetical protein